MPTTPSQSYVPGQVMGSDDGVFVGHIADPGRSSVSWACLTQRAQCAAAVIRAAAAAAATAPSGPFNLSSLAVAAAVILVWNAAPEGDPATSFVVEAGSVSGASDLAVFDTGSRATSLTVTGVPTGTYFVRVRARNAAGLSGASNEVIVVVPGAAACQAPPPAPTGLTASASGSSFVLQWTGVAGAAAYVIEAGSTSGAANLALFDTGTTATAFSGTAAQAPTMYEYARGTHAAAVTHPTRRS
jgi:hypothetical protein